VKEPDDLPCCLVDGCKIAALRPIANEAGPSQVGFDRFSAMLYGDDMVRFMWQEGIVFVKQAVFATEAGTFTNEPA